MSDPSGFFRICYNIIIEVSNVTFDFTISLLQQSIVTYNVL